MQDYHKSSTDFSKAELAGKYLYQRAADGVSSTIYQCLRTARLLRLAGENPDKGSQISFSPELLHYAMRLGSLNQDSIYKTAVNLANLIITDIRRSRNEPSKIASTLAPLQRKILWRKLHLIPGGANAEIDFAQKNWAADLDTSQSLLSSIRLGIINHYNGHFCLDIISNILGGASAEHFNTREPLIPGSRLVTGEVRGIILNIQSSATQGQPGSDLYRLGLELAKDNILIKNCSFLNLGNLIESAIKTADELNIDTYQLPLIIRILDYPKASADYCTFLAFGWLLHISSHPEITASKAVLKNINDIIDNLSLGKIMVEKNFYKIIRLYKTQIEKKRASLGLS